MERIQKIFGKTIQEIKEGNLVIVHDIESGHPYWVTQEQREGIIKAWKACEPKLDIIKDAPLLVYGTGGDMGNVEGLEDMFYNPQNYKLIDHEQDKK